MDKTFVQKLKALWEGWKHIAHIIGNFQARVLLTVLYAILVLPFGVIVRLFSDPLRIKHRPELWIDHPLETQDMSWAHKQ